MAISSAEFEERTYLQVTLRLIPFLMICYVVAYLDRVNVGFAKLQMLPDLGLNEADYGVGASAFFVGYILFGIPSNLLALRFGARVWIACIMAVWGLLSSLMMFVTTSSEFFFLRFLLGVAEAGFYPGVILYLTRWFPSQRRGRALSLFQSAIALAGLIGNPVSGWILDHLQGYADLKGWQWLFLIEALPAVLAAALVSYFLTNDIADAQWLGPKQQEFLIQKVADDHSSTTAPLFISVFTDIRVWTLCLLVFGLIMGLYAISFWMPTLLHDAGLGSNSEVGLLSSIPNLAALVGMFLFARSSDKKRERRYHVAAAATLGSVGLVASVALDHQPILATLSLSVAAVGLLSALPLQWNLLSTLSSRSTAAVTIGLVNSFSSLGGIVSPALIGWLKNRMHSIDVGMYIIASCVMISALLALSFPRTLDQQALLSRS